MGGFHSTDVVRKTTDIHDKDVQKWLQSPEDRFFVNLRAPNLLQVVDAPREILQHLLQALGSMATCVRPVWRPNCYEIALSGSPFMDNPTCRNDRNTLIDASFCRFLSLLHTQNWYPYMALNLSPFCDRSTCYFRKMNRRHSMETEEHSGKPTVVSVTFLSPFVIDMTCNDDSCLDSICGMVGSALTHLEAKEWTCTSTEYSRRVTVSCNLWKSVSLPDSIFNRRLLLAIVSQLENVGYRLQTCIDFRGNADTLFFVNAGPEMARDHTGTYCMLSANRWDLLRLYEASKDLVDVTRLLLNQHWPQGVESERGYPTWHEFQFSAFPWAARAADAAQSYSMISTLLQTYLARGWKPIASVQMSRTFKDRSCIILRKEKPAYRPHMCLGLLDSNELHLINAEDDLRDYLLDLVCSPAIVKGKLSKNGAWPSLTLKGDPWCTISLANYQNGQKEAKETDYDYLQARAFVQKLLVALRFRGWDTVIHVDLAARVKYKRKSSSSGSLKNNSGSKASGLDTEQSMPLDVNSLILANVNGSRHNSFARSANESLLVIRSQSLSIE